MTMRVLMGGTAAEFVLQPKITKAVVFQPIPELLRGQFVELRPAFYPVRHDDVFRFEMIDQER